MKAEMMNRNQSKIGMRYRKNARWVLLFALAIGLLIGFTISSSALAAGPPQNPVLIVKLIGGLSPDQEAAVIVRNGGVEKSAIPQLRMHVIEVPASELSAIFSNYQTDPQVERVEINKTRKTEGTPSDPSYNDQWALPKISWDQVYDPSLVTQGSVTVAVLDTGIDATHPDLSSVVTGTSILDGSDGLTDPNGHGTWMAGIIAAVPNNNIGIAGVAFSGVSIMPVTVLGADGTGQDSDIIAGLMYAADHGASVILMGFSNPGFSQSLQDAIDYAWSQDIVIVAATGNDGLSTETYPAGDKYVVGVSATDPDDNLASFSNYGTDVFLAAPGVGILTTAPTNTTDVNASYTTINGTSASSAIVAGVAAFMKAVDPTLTKDIIVGRLAQSADPAGTIAQTGNGRVNMARAVSDTSVDSVEPAGSANGGGPFVGPYTVAANCAAATTCTSVATGLWATAGTWNCNCTPIADTIVTIAPTHTITMNGNAGVCGSLTINGTATWAQARTTNVGAGGITINPGGNITGAVAGVLTTTGNLTVNAATTSTTVVVRMQTTGGQTISGTGSLGRLAINSTTTNNGNLTVTTVLSGTSALTNGAGATLNIGGTSTITTLTADAAGNSVNYNGAVQTVKAATYNDLTLSGGAKTLPNAAWAINGDLTLITGTATTATTRIATTIGGNLDVQSGNTLTMAGFNITVTGTTTVSGTLAHSSATGTKTFTGLVTINPGGSWTNAINEAITFGGGLTNNGSFAWGTGIQTVSGGNLTYAGTAWTTGTGSFTFSGGGQQIICDDTHAFTIPTLTVNNTVTNNCTGGLTVSSSLAGSSTLTQATNAILNIDGTSTITNLDATTTTPNTVNYIGVAQTVKATVYSNLTLSGSGAKTLTGVSTINGSLTLAGTASATLTAATAVSGDVTIGLGTTLDVSATNYALNVGGDWANSGTFTPRAGTVTFNGAAAQTISNATTWYRLAIIGGSRTVSFQSGVAQTVSNSLTLTGTLGNVLVLAPATAGSAWQLHAPATQSISYVSVSYSDASGGATINADGTNTNGGNNTNWTFPTMTAVGSSANPSAYGQSITFTATVSGSGATPSGTVQFKIDGSDFGSPATLSGGSATSGATSALSVGSHTVTAVYSGDSSFTTSTGTLSGGQTVNKADPSVTTWPSAAAITYGQTLASSTLSGGAATPVGTFAFTTPGAVPGAGTASQSVTYTPTDTSNYNTATSTVSVTVNKADPSVTTWPTASGITYGQALSASTLSGGSASVPGAYAFTVPSTTPSAGTYSASVTFTPTDASNYNSVTSNVNVGVAKADPNVTTWPSAAAITYGQTLASSTLSGGAATPVGSFAFTTPGAAPGAGTASQSVTYTPTDTSNYNTATSTVSVTVNKADPSVTTWPTASGITYGQTLANSTLTGGTSTPAGTFAFTTPGTAPATGTASQDVTFTPTDTVNYNSGATSTVSVTVNKADPSVTVWPTASAITYGQTLASSTLSGGVATPAGSFAFTTPGATPNAGTASQSVTYTPTDTTNYNTAIGSASVTVNKADQATLNSVAPANLAYGSTVTLSTTGGSGTGAVTYNVGASTGCSVLGSILSVTDASGICSVTGTKAADTNYNAATSSAASVTLIKGNQTISFGALVSKNYGDGAFTVSATATSGLGVSFTSLTSEVCTVSVNTVTIVAPGTCTIEASQTGDANYSAAANVDQSFTVSKTSQTITVSTAAPARAAFNATFTVAAIASSGLAVNYSSGTPAVCTNVGQAFTMVSPSGNCIVQFDQPGNTNYNAAPRVTNTTTARITPTARFNWKTDATTDYNILFDASSSICPAGGTCTYNWDFGGTGTGTGVTTSHTFSSGVYVVTLTVTDDATTGGAGTKAQSITPLPIHTKPTVATTAAPSVNLWTVTFTDASSAMAGLTIPANGVIVNWGDNTVEKKAAGSVFTHEYKRASTYTIMHSVIDSGGAVVPAVKLSSTNKYKVTVPVKFSLSGLVTTNAGVGLRSTRVMLKLNGHTVATTATDAAGSYSFTSKVLPTRTSETYTVQAYRYRYTFPAPTPFSVTATTTAPTILSAE